MPVWNCPPSKPSTGRCYSSRMLREAASASRRSAVTSTASSASASARYCASYAVKPCSSASAYAGSARSRHGMLRIGSFATSRSTRAAKSGAIERRRVCLTSAWETSAYKRSDDMVSIDPEPMASIHLCASSWSSSTARRRQLASRTALVSAAMHPPLDLLGSLVADLPDDFMSPRRVRWIVDLLGELTQTLPDGSRAAFTGSHVLEDLERFRVHRTPLPLRARLERLVDLRGHVADVQRGHAPHASTVLAPRS